MKSLGNFHPVGSDEIISAGHVAAPLCIAVISAVQTGHKLVNTSREI